MSRVLEDSRSRRRELDDWLVGRRHAVHAVAAARIGLGLAILGLLVTNFANRQVWVGDASVWAEPARAVSRFPEIALLDGVSADLLTVVYVLVGLAAVAFVLGWHAKAATVVLLVGFIAVTGQNPLLSAASDNLVRIALLWMLLIRTSDVWSLDAARARPAEAETAVPEWLRSGLHNVGLVGLGAQVALSYLAAGLDKVSQPSWQDGTALFTTLQLPEYRAFPAVADFIADGTVPLAVVTWAVLGVQLFFVPMLLRRWSRDVVAIAAIAVNLLFAVVLATPWASLTVIALTGLFVTDERWEALGLRVGDLAAPVTDRVAEGWYVVADKVEDWWFRYVLGAFDWVRFTVFRR